MDCIYRPKIHFTPKANWMNDPNGLVYEETTREYHLFFQYCDTLKEDQTKKFWGHAVSKDLCHWEELVPAIWPDGLGGAWSGSCVIDKYNTSGFFDDSVAPESRLVALYTSAYGDVSLGYQKQSVAYSKNNGRTWIKYEGNPVIYETQQEGVVFANRDPKVFWYSDKSRKFGGVWVMVIAGMWARIFTSENLREWTFQGDIMMPDGQRHLESECPDLFSIEVDGNPKKIKWVYTCAGRGFVVGDFIRENDGRYMFKPETDYIQPLVGCDDMYAAQSFSNEPKGRRIGIYWMIDLSSREPNTLKEKAWDGYQSIPVEYKLKNTVDGYKLFLYPVEELAGMRAEKLADIQELMIKEDDSVLLLEDDGSSPIDMELEIDISENTSFDVILWEREEQKIRVGYDKSNSTICLDRNESGYLKTGRYEMPVSIVNNMIKLRITLDASIVDVFANDGEAMINSIVFPKRAGGRLKLLAKNGGLKINRAKVYKLM